MKYTAVRNLKDESFRRLTGIKRLTFEKMIEILREAHKKKKSKGGRKNALCIEDMLLMSLEYLREYRTYFHCGQSFGISESAAFNTIRWVEDTLIKHPDFSLPGRKELLKSDMEYEVVLIDATESPIERPKKSKNTSIPEKRRGILDHLQKSGFESKEWAEISSNLSLS
jgi:hypothetical protein